MKKFYFGLFCLFLFSFPLLPQQKFAVDISDTTHHQFKVTLIPDALTASNNIYQFAASAPGTYEIMDIGRYVTSFKVFDLEGNEIPSTHISTNQWQISDPVHTTKIEYYISDTWNSKIKEHAPYPMSGSNLESTNTLINGQCVFGYFSGMQQDSVYVKIVSPFPWKIATAMPLNKDKYYAARNYDMLVDSPILSGNLTEAETQIGKCKVSIYTFSKTGLIKSDDILKAINDILKAEDKFIEGLPVNHYTFLFHFGNATYGAWEHMYSSDYVFAEQPLTGEFKERLIAGISHEFFHIVTPLNIHSQLVEPFNFVHPVMSEHLWFYEGVTEWAAWMLQLRAGLISLQDYLRNLQFEIAYSDNFRKDISLRDLSVHAYDLENQYQNIYQKGAVTAGLLDIYLLKLSNGKKGLRDVVIELMKKYGPDKPFDENGFFDEFVNLTYPEVRTFLDKYIINATPLPLKEYLGWLGIDYKEFSGVDSTRFELGFGISLQDNQLVISNIIDSSQTEMKIGDKLLKVMGTPVTVANVQQAFNQLRGKKAGDRVEFTLARNGKDFQVQWRLPYAMKKHVIEILQSPTEEQLQLRKAWMTNQ